MNFIRRLSGGGDAGGTVVEYTAGTTGTSLALVCAALGFRLHVVFSEQLNHLDGVRGYLAMGEGIWTQAGVTAQPSSQWVMCPPALGA